ncbi:MAG: SGNH/GDSL hydrolase family protein, partial [Puniceicoccales bacterium]
MIPKIAYCALLMCTQWIHAADFSDLQLYNAGRGGNNTRQGLARFDQDVLEVHPDTVIIFFGMNDAINSGASIPLDAFEQNLTEMVTRSKANGITPYLVTVHSVIEEPLYQRHSQKLESFYLARGGANAIIESYNPVIRKVAQETDTRLIDFSKAAKDHLRNSPDVPLVVPDGVHLSPSGKKLLADTIAPYLIDQSPKPEKVVCFGDSLTRLGYDTELYSLLDPERFPKYTTSVPSAKAHPDLDPPIRLFDKKSKGVSLNSVEYRGDVEVLVDLEQTSFV